MGPLTVAVCAKENLDEVLVAGRDRWCSGNGEVARAR
jgi:hypothetical protein